MMHIWRNPTRRWRMSSSTMSGDSPRAERAFQHAIALNPHYAVAHHWYSVYLTAMERPEDARRAIQRAHELDPLSLIIHTDMGFALYYARQYDQAITQLRTTLEMNRQFPLANLWLGRACQEQGRYAEALAAFREASTGLGEWPVTIAAMGYVYGVSGQTTQARQVLAQLHQLAQHRYVTAYGVALVYAGLGEYNHAFAWLQKAIEERTHWLVWLPLDPRWDSLRADPRFVDVRRASGSSPQPLDQKVRLINDCRHIKTQMSRMTTGSTLCTDCGRWYSAAYTTDLGRSPRNDGSHA